ncbi:hypothetical protein FIBSPDRAFT_267737 [Athelia psychrophila]|uniref:ZZ-type domain-containing protein n=1 Tax=Athelia psychrophila TaxID=1759441 RepID=A0A166RHF1_9AGAM|nr:hypothetical protein FIBSPDRAFT_267737 [Fibularhizoctonia sp. CBS 109695]
MRDVRPAVNGVETKEIEKTEEPEKIKLSEEVPDAEKEEEKAGGGEVKAADTEELAGKPQAESEKPDGDAEAAGEEVETDAEAVVEEPEETGPTGPKHPAVCDECRALKTDDKEEQDLIVGVRWKCMVCEWYDLCDRCHSAGVHDEHEMLKIEHPDDALDIEQPDKYTDDMDSVLLGLRVYSKCPVSISGQLANGFSVGFRKNP